MSLVISLVMEELFVMDLNIGSVMKPCPLLKKKSITTSNVGREANHKEENAKCNLEGTEGFVCQIAIITSG